MSETYVRATVRTQHGPVGKSKCSGVIIMCGVGGCSGGEQGRGSAVQWLSPQILETKALTLAEHMQLWDEFVKDHHLASPSEILIVLV